MKTNRKNRKRICSLLLCQTMVLSMMSLPAMAEESDSSLYVGGVQVTEENAADIFGDGTASYDSETGTLQLADAEITSGYETDLIGDMTIGIYSEAYLNIELVGTNKISLGDTESNCFGIYAVDGLSMNGEGELCVASETLTAASDSDDLYMNVGIFAAGAMEICGASVTAAGGDIKVSSESEESASNAYSCGVYALGGVSVDFGGSLSATAGQVTAENALSFGILANYENVCVYDGTLEAVGGDSTGQHYASSAGICTADNGVYVYEAGAEVSVRAGKAVGTEMRSNALYIAGGDLGIDAGTIQIVGGAAEGNDAAVYVEGYEDEDGCIVGGTVNIAAGTQVMIEAADGSAVYAQSGINVDEALTLSVPEHGEVAGQGELDEATDCWEYYTVVDANGEAASEVAWN